MASVAWGIGIAIGASKAKRDTLEIPRRKVAEMQPSPTVMEEILSHGATDNHDWTDLNLCAEALGRSPSTILGQLRFCVDLGYAELDPPDNPSRFRVTYQGHYRDSLAR